MNEQMTLRAGTKMKAMIFGTNRIINRIKSAAFPENMEIIAVPETSTVQDLINQIDHDKAIAVLFVDYRLIKSRDLSQNLREMINLPVVLMVDRKHTELETAIDNAFGYLDIAGNCKLIDSRLAAILRRLNCREAVGQAS